ncbi:MAG: hypothetical protein ACQET5_10760 [Halobacteriota archaeon]|uniref:hypothetical protein n=1 Tax=Natronomonas sp. TaxID=2184060 RepID=UPI0039765AC7
METLAETGINEQRTFDRSVTANTQIGAALQPVPVPIGLQPAESRAERTAIEPKRLFSRLESALTGIDDDIDHSGFSIGDVDVTLKTNVTQSDGDVRFHLPSHDERSATENNSQLSFTSS